MTIDNQPEKERVTMRDIGAMRGKGGSRDEKAANLDAVQTATRSNATNMWQDIFLCP
jgi:hypothetical protein